MTTSKKIIAATILLMGISSHSFAQQALASNSVKSPGATIMASENGSKTTVDATDPMIVSKFSTLFPNATNLKWSGSDENFLVSFVNNGRKANASFNAKAEMNYVITECSMEQLPAAFSKSILKDYASYHLFSAKEITAHSNIAYQAVLENAKGFVTLKYTTEGIEMVQQVRKAGN